MFLCVRDIAALVHVVEVSIDRFLLVKIANGSRGGCSGSACLATEEHY